MNYKVLIVKNNIDVKEFTRLPELIYKGDKNWTPHLYKDVESVFDKNINKYHQHGKCQRWILKDENNNTVGRIAAFINNKKAYTFKQPTGGIGFFECINDLSASTALFDVATGWLKENNMQAADGPINFGENHRFWGLLIENFSFPTYHGQNYNPPYYVKQFEDYGFKIYYNQIINYRKVSDPVPEKYMTKARVILANKHYKIETIEKSNLAKYAEDFRTVYNAAWKTHDGFKEMSSKMALSLFKKMKRIIDPELISFIYFNDYPVGFCLGIPDINPIIRRIGGKLNLVGKVKFFILLKTIKLKRINGIAMGICPEHQQKGIEAALFTDLAQRVMANGQYEDVVVTWVGDFNPKMQYIFDNLGFHPIAKMATYRKLFDPEAEFERSPILQ